MAETLEWWNGDPEELNAMTKGKGKGFGKRAASRVISLTFDSIGIRMEEREMARMLEASPGKPKDFKAEAREEVEMPKEEAEPNTTIKAIPEVIPSNSNNHNNRNNNRPGGVDISKADLDHFLATVERAGSGSTNVPNARRSVGFMGCPTRACRKRTSETR